RAEAAHRLDRALPRLLDGAHRSPREITGEGGRMKLSDKTVKAETDTLAFEIELGHSPEKVWRALTDPALLSEWLLPVAGLELAPGVRFTFQAPPQPGWDG